MSSLEQTPSSSPPPSAGAAEVNNDELLGGIFGQDTSDRNTLARALKPLPRLDRYDYCICELAAALPLPAARAGLAGTLETRGL
jgi:hypothetical protein